MNTTDARRRTLLLFTSTFPYGVGEQFLEQEIAYLAEGFQQVIVIPDRITAQRRQLPANVRVAVDPLPDRLRPPEVLRLPRALSTALRSPLAYAELRAHPELRLAPVAWRRIIGYLGDMLRVRRWLGNYLRYATLDPADLICYSYWLSYQAAALVHLKAEWPMLRVVARAHNHDLYLERQTPPYIPLRSFLLDGLDRIFPVSAHGCTYLINERPQIASRCELARLGVADPGFRAQASQDGRLRVVSCSYMVPVKRLDRLIAGLRVAAQARPDLPIEWCHMGDGPLRPQLELLAQTQLPASVRWHMRGQIPNHAVIQTYREQAVDVFANVSSSEGVPVSIMEAQSCGIPVVATAVGGSPELVDADCGCLLPADAEASAIGMALLRFAPGRPGLATVRAAARQRWAALSQAKHNFPHFVARLHQV